MAVGGIGYLDIVILALSLGTTEYSPVTQMASDYGVGGFAFWMNSGFFLAGVGFVSLGTVLAFSHRVRLQRAGGALLITAGVALLLSSVNATDIEGTTATVHGTIHGIVGVLFFLSAPIGLLMASRGFGTRWTAYTLAAFGVALLSLILDSALGVGAAGLAERVVILVTFGSAILTALRTYRES